MRIIFIFVYTVLILSADNICLSQDLLYKKGRPTTEGIKQYIEQNQESLQHEFQIFIGDSLDYIYLETQDLNTYYQHDSLELGCFYFPDEVIITTEPVYLDYELQFIKKYRRLQYAETNQFVKAVVMHELMHRYFYLIMQRMQDNKKHISPEYLQTLRIWPNNDYGSEFCEEGLCEYLPYAMQEIIGDNKYSPLTIEEIINNRNTYAIKYRYARIFVEPLVRKYGWQRTIELILTNKPPSMMEILQPEKYYSRLVER